MAIRTNLKALNPAAYHLPCLWLSKPIVTTRGTTTRLIHGEGIYVVNGRIENVTENNLPNATIEELGWNGGEYLVAKLTNGKEQTFYL